MTNSIASDQIPQSEKEVRKHSSRFSAGYWVDRLFRPTYVRDGETFQVAEWYAQIQYGGKRQKVGLASNDKEAASRKAAKLYQDIRTKGWTEALKLFAPERNDSKNRSTVGGHIELVTPLLRVRPVSAKKYAYCLRRIACDIAGVNDGGNKKYDPTHKPWQDKADKIKLSVLNPLAIEGWKVAFLKQAQPSPTEQLAARRNVNYFIRNARSLFGQKARRRVQELRLPEFQNPFQGVQLENQGSTRYVSMINAQELLRKARKDLSRRDPESWKVILLALGAGLRRGEIDGLCIPQIDDVNHAIRVMVHDHFDAKTDESIGVVHVDVAFIEELKKHIDPSSPFIVEPKIPAAEGQRAPGYYRCDYTFTRVTKWLRDNGVPQDRPLHVLRKEFGSIVNAQSDIHTASSQLRHGSIATTAAFYADNRRRSPVPIGDMLRARKKGSTKESQKG